MILPRLGNKKKIAKEIQKYFPPHKIYIEPFFGAGGMFFNKPKAKYNIVNDLDSDVFNLFQCVMNRREELEKAFYLMPIHSDLLEYWKHNQETEPIKKALRFLLLSNFTFLGKMDCLSFGPKNPKKQFYKFFDFTFNFLENVQFNNTDFRKFFKSFEIQKNNEKIYFIYCDPPYINTVNKYEEGFNKNDCLDLFNALNKTGVNWAYSEFNNPFILDQAKTRGLNVHIIGERQNLKNRRTEILITNYENNQLKLF